MFYFDQRIASDSIERVIINRTLAKQLGWTPDEAVDKHYDFGGDNETPPPGFFPTYDVLNFRKYSNHFIEGEEVISQVQVFDIFGKIWKVEEGMNQEKVKLNLESLPAGYYNIQITSANGIVQTKKIIKS